MCCLSLFVDDEIKIILIVATVKEDLINRMSNTNS
jgi:hypothetical protein